MFQNKAYADSILCDIIYINVYFCEFFSAFIKYPVLYFTREKVKLHFFFLFFWNLGTFHYVIQEPALENVNLVIQFAARSCNICMLHCSLHCKLLFSYLHLQKLSKRTAQSIAINRS